MNVWFLLTQGVTVIPAVKEMHLHGTYIAGTRQPFFLRKDVHARVLGHIDRNTTEYFNRFLPQMQHACVATVGCRFLPRCCAGEGRTSWRRSPDFGA